MAHVFISYSRKDLAFVNRLVQDLQQANVPIWFDQISIQPGDNWEAAIEKGLRDAIAVAIIISPDSMASEYVRKEVNFANESDQTLLPILHRPASLFLNLQTIQWVDLSSDTLYPTNLPKLLAVLQREPGLTPNSLLRPATTDEVMDTRRVNSTHLRNYLHIQTLITGPTSQLEWRRLAGEIVSATQVAISEQGVALALTRLNPPTAIRLAAVAAPILHLACRIENDVLYLEDENGQEVALTPDTWTGLFKNSDLRLLILQGIISETATQKLMKQSQVQAVVCVSPTASPLARQLFEESFFKALAIGKSVRVAYENAVQQSPDEANNFQLSLKSGLTDVNLDLPPLEKRATQPLIDPGLPPIRNVPINTGFVGRNDALQELSEKLSPADARQVMIYGLGGIGKSWLAAEFVARFGWRFPDGIVWIRLSEQTRATDIIGQLLALLELPPQTPLPELENILRQRRVLIILDQANEWENPTEIKELATLLARLDTLGGTRVMLTAWTAIDTLSQISGGREFSLAEMLPTDAEQLVRRLIEEHDLAEEFKENALVRLLEKTYHTPWLIKEGLRIARLDGIEAALEDLDQMTTDIATLYEQMVGRQVQKLTEATRDFLRRLQGLPDGFDRTLAQAIEKQSREHLRHLVQAQLLRREDKLYTIPKTVRNYLHQKLPLPEHEQDVIDGLVIQHWLQGT